VSLVLIGILSVQFGAAVSKGLFGEIPPVGMVLLRLVTSSLILLALARPWLGGRTAADWRPVLALGVSLGAMNWAFYESFARIPLGVAVTIEFVGPAGGCWALYIVSTVATGRRWAGVEGLAVASTVAALAIAPFAVATAGARLLEPRLLVLGILVGLLSSVIPYSLEMAALRTLPPRCSAS
jgi:inner membrane transporter RhtA